MDALGNPLRLELTAEQRHDSVVGYEMLNSIGLTQKQVLADWDYDTNRILKLLKEQEAAPVIPSTVEYSENGTKKSTKNGI
ncbi:hypothetical protein [Paenibacillus terrae]|uniref:hypothetical protein n=1 Tax=Paenibacillus terrae TaxID=159743 RepID=UPI0033656B4D